ncbi:ATP-grasp domain-containing protein [Actinospica durhamensis]|uniref:ATP-grasp domain-containing protein n=1 Tax=Actinospica durhamensis TaxID=1508375 RepID=A0A941IMV4_9ACTN|nr:ATP-grasp domain-containing protein [Actinospica durhamensis]MBR7834645.1 ATP-grasp domain-containing protein [Actinospica durhamensis]
MHILLLHPVSDWSLERVAEICAREGWLLTIATIESATIGDAIPTLHEWIRVPALTDDPRELLAQIGSRRFDAVVAGNEFAVVAADVLARELGLHHNDVEKIRASRNKPLMREAFERHGVPQPRTIARFASLEESRGFDWESVAFPVIVKPIDMAMSLFVRRCESRAEVEETIARMADFKLSRLTNYVFATGALVEEYAEGPEFSIECVVQDGSVVAYSFTRKFVSPLPTCYEVAHLTGEEIPERHRGDLLAACENIAAGWGLVRGVMHVEFKMTDERLSVIEAGARPPGDHVPELVELQHGFSLEEAFLHSRLGLDWKAPDRPHRDEEVWHGIRFEYEERSAATRPESVEVLRAENSLDGIVAGADLFSVNSRTGYALVRGTSSSDLDDYLRAL